MPLSNCNPIDSGRVILVLGSPRSGTTWLAKILDTAREVLYLHEPLLKLWYPPIMPILHRLKRGQGLGPEERSEMVAHLRQMHHGSMRLPFFPKGYRRLPGWALDASWILLGLNRAGRDLFRRLHSPPSGSPFDLLIKEVDWQTQCGPIVEGLKPDKLIIVVRHPCGVVLSRLTGLKIGVIPGHDRAKWLAHHQHRAAAAGFSADRVLGMTPWAFYALDWLLQNLQYQEIARSHPSCRTVVFQSLCADPVGETAKLFDWLGWERTPATERFIEASGRGASRRRMFGWLNRRRWYYGLSRNADEAANNWKRELTPQQIEEILDITKGFPGMSWWAEPGQDDSSARGPRTGIASSPEPTRGALGD